MTAILILHVLLGCILVLCNGRIRRSAFFFASLGPLSTIVWLVLYGSNIVAGRAEVDRLDWIPELGLRLDLRVDALSVVMLILVAGIGLLVCLYSFWYFPDTKPALGRLAGLLTVFSGAMTGLVTADHLMTLFVFWELTTVTSYLLIGNDDQKATARDAALSAILITGAGGLVMLAGFVVLGQGSGTYSLSQLTANPQLVHASWLAVVAILVGAMTKSAQFPFSSWLPGAMVAPTPISAYLHAATMVKAGVYLVARLAPVLSDVSSWRPVLFVFGSITMIFGGWRALRQMDLKVLLAHGTVSQLGFMMIVFGAGKASLARAGVVLLLAHGVFKAALFMVVGIIDHQLGTRDVRRIGRLGTGWRTVHVVTFLAAGSMAGVPPMIGFIAKEKVLVAATSGGFPGATAITAVVVVGSILTFAYSARFVLGVMGRLTETEDRVGTSWATPPPSSSFMAPAVLLGFLTIALGIFPLIIDEIVQSATRTMYPSSSPSVLELWAGFDTAVGLSLIIIGVGSILVYRHGRVSTMQRRFHDIVEPLPSADTAFWSLLDGIIRFAKQSTRIVQNGSLPIYVMVILGVSALGMLVPLTGVVESAPLWIDSWVQLAPLTFVVIAAMGAALVTRRMSAALLLGAVGYGMAGLYVINGAPDMALTQFAIETLATVVFVLVLRVLPRDFDDETRSVFAPVRLLVSLAIGVGVFLFALVAVEARSDVASPSISKEMMERSLPDAYGANVVNVILVDFRGFDTMAEITVLLVAALGTVALVRTKGKNRSNDVPNDASADAAYPPSRILDAISQLLFTSIVVFATYFLFAGHNQPGGGFVGGLTVGAGICLRFVSGGSRAVRGSVRVPARVLLGAGLGLAVSTAVVPLILGGSVLEHALWTWTAPVVGTIKTTSALPFDIGVFLVVVGLISMAIEAFGDDSDSSVDSDDDVLTRSAS